MRLLTRRPRDYYVRPHCSRCNLIWKKNAFSVLGAGFIMPLQGSHAKCPKCGGNIVYTDYNPWQNAIDTFLQAATLVILYVVFSLIATAIFSAIGLVGWSNWVLAWVVPVGLLGWVFSNIRAGFKQWAEIQKLDQGK